MEFANADRKLPTSVFLFYQFIGCLTIFFRLHNITNFT